MNQNKFLLNKNTAVFWSWLTDSLYYQDPNGKKVALVKKEEMDRKIIELTTRGDYVSIRNILSLAETANLPLLDELTSRSFRISTPMYFKLIIQGLNKGKTLNKIIAGLITRKIKQILQELGNEQEVIPERLETIEKIADTWLSTLLEKGKKHSRKNYYLSCKWPITSELKRKLSRMIYYHYGKKKLSEFHDLQEEKRDELLKVWWDQYESVSKNNEDEFFELTIFLNEIPEKRAAYVDLWINYYYRIVPFVLSLEKVYPPSIFEKMTNSFSSGQGKYFTNKNGNNSAFLLMYGDRSVPYPVSEELDLEISVNTIDLENYHDVNFPVEMTLLEFVLYLTEDGELQINETYSLRDPKNLVKVFEEMSLTNSEKLDAELKKYLEGRDYGNARRISDHLAFYSLEKEILFWLQENFSKLVNSSQVVSLRLPKCLDFVVRAFRERFDLSQMLLELKDEVNNEDIARERTPNN